VDAIQFRALIKHRVTRAQAEPAPLVPPEGAGNDLPVKFQQVDGIPRNGVTGDGGFDGKSRLFLAHYQPLVKLRQHLGELHQHLGELNQTLVQFHQVFIQLNQALIQLNQTLIQLNQTLVQLNQVLIQLNQAPVQFPQTAVQLHQAVVQPYQNRRDSVNP
jgi:hypothetical protein